MGKTYSKRNSKPKKHTLQGDGPRKFKYNDEVEYHKNKNKRTNDIRESV